MPSKPPTFRPPGYQTYAEARSNERQRGYSKRWSKASALFKRRHPLCVGCQAVGWVEAASVTDHIVPHNGDECLFWDESNWQPCCDWHHSVVKQRLEMLWLQGKAGDAALRLDSAPAITLTRELMGRGG